MKRQREEIQGSGAISIFKTNNLSTSSSEHGRAYVGDYIATTGSRVNETISFDPMVDDCAGASLAVSNDGIGETDFERRPPSSDELEAKKRIASANKDR